MGIELPKARFSAPPQPKRRQVPIEQIMQVMGNNPLAQGIEDVGASLSKALADRAQRRRQQQVVASLAQAAGESPPTDAPGMTPTDYEGLQRIKTERASKKATAAKERVALEMDLEKIRKGYIERDPVTGATRTYPGTQDFNIDYDEDGNPVPRRGPNYSPGMLPKLPGGGGSGKVGRNQQVGVTPEGYTISFNPDKKVNEVARPNGKGGYSIEPYYGNALPKTIGSEEQAKVGFATRGNESLSRVKEIFQQNPGTFTEFKGIKFSPGKVYQQLASPQAKEAFTNVQNIIQSEAYATTGKAMNEKELENKTLMFMVALNDSPGDFETRLGIANKTLQAMTMRRLPTLPVQGGGNETPEQRKARLLQELAGAQ